MRASTVLAALSMSAVAACDSPTATTSVPDISVRNLVAPSCEDISGTVDAAFVSGTQIQGTIAGSVEGAAFATVDQLIQSGKGAYHVLLRHRYVTASGDEVRTTDEGVLTPIDPPIFRFNNRLTVVGGTGVFVNATGTIHAHGTVILGGAIDLRYHGRVCGIGAP